MSLKKTNFVHFKTAETKIKLITKNAHIFTTQWSIKHSVN